MIDKFDFIEPRESPKIIRTLDLTEFPETKVTIVEPFFWIRTKINAREALASLEDAGRVCYKSEEKIGKEPDKMFLASAIKRGHFSILEHETISVRVVCDRGVTHELVRHRLAAYSQESTRYCNYGKLGVQYIYPFFWELDSEPYKIWEQSIINASLDYLRLLNNGATPQQARSVLPNSLKTEIIATCNIREWRHIFYLRTTAAAHPQIRQVALSILKTFKERIPVFFDDFVIDAEKMTAATKIYT